ncbi:retinoic acid receptor responder protein 2-like isoform X2 [Rhinatrema bivittatum]|uniref:retinoic acid receptor responder protein 2-like isoform X2 n=1 Tax=Rhinatrema bivittatum TaxID=194408 RepID=UPI00112B008C|nr:retinoic acid receptor responder protein 2-like isoform X2 [Rhinatrema bivittatum]
MEQEHLDLELPKLTVGNCTILQVWHCLTSHFSLYITRDQLFLLQATTAGNFVKVTYTIKQTNCHKMNYQPDMCQHRANGRVRYCLACFAYQNSEAEPNAQFVDCLPRFPPGQERANQQMQRCEAVKKTILDYLPGKFVLMELKPHPDYAERLPTISIKNL